MKQSCDVLIIGGGIAGLSAALYAARYDLKTYIITKELGGATTTAWIIDNYPGAKHIDGFDLVKTVQNQAEELGAVILSGEATRLKRDEHRFIIETSAGDIEANSIILALGSDRRHLGLPREHELLGKGVHYCATCDAPLYKSKKVVIVGGGDSSVKGAILASSHAEHVYLVTIEKSLHGEPINMDHLQKLRNVTVRSETTISALHGEDRLTGVMLRHNNGTIEELACDGIFIEIGALPTTDIAKEFGIELDEKGYIATNFMCETNIPGIMAAGDTTNMFGAFKQDITAAAQGAVAATATYRYLSLHPDSYFCHTHARPHKKSRTQ